MTKRELMKLTDFDRKRKVTKQMQYRMHQMLDAGKDIKTIAEHFNVTPHTVKYNTDPEFKKQWNTKRNGKHYGSNNTYTSADRGAYKRELLKNRKSVIVPV